MGWATRLGRARISASAPRAAGQCDRCGFIYTHSDLAWQMDFAGTGLINKRMLVCERCNDRPQEQLRSIVIPADPVPIQNPRVPNWAAQRTDRRITIGPTTTDPRTSLQTRSGDPRVTEDKNTRIVEKNGDAMQASKLIVRTRVTEKTDRRITQETKGLLRGVPDVRVTQLMSPVQPAPIPQPTPLVDVIRVTQAGDQRLTEDGRIREASEKVVVLEGRVTADGQERVTQSNDLLGSLVAVDASNKRNGNG